METGEFYAFFMRVVPAWQQQDNLQRSLVILLDDWLEATPPEGRSALAAAVRRVARDAMGDAS
jgi:hypothetical protein